MTNALSNLRRLAECLPGPMLRFEVRAGDAERFIAELHRAGVRKVAFERGEEVSITSMISHYSDVHIVTCNALPEDMAVLVDEDGKVHATWSMGEWP